MLIQGDAQHIPLKDESVQCCVTSPPYWGLRDYEISPRVWPKGFCSLAEHCWDDYLAGDNRGGSGTPTDKNNRGESYGRASERGRFCLQCRAWSGCLGLEPTPELFVEHIVAVFREVRRVLADDGTLWLNLSSSYAGSWGNYHPNSPPGKHGQRLKETARWNRPAYESQEFLPPTANIKGFKPKDLVPIPWMVAMALQADGWWLRSDIIWSKPNPMPESVKDRPTKSHEYIFLLSKSERYYFDQDAVREPMAYAHEAKWDPGTNGLGGDDRHTGKSTRRFPAASHKGSTFHGGKTGVDQHHCSDAPRVDNPIGRNIRSVWQIATEPYPEAHFATFPEELAKRCILAGCPSGGLVLDPFGGSCTTVKVAQDLGRRGIALELKPEYLEIGKRRSAQQGLIF